MNNPFQEQLLKAGLVTKEQVHKAQKEKHKNSKQKRPKKQRAAPDDNAIKAREAAAQKAKHDRELNQKKQEQARQKAVSVEINQLILQNQLKQNPDDDVAYRFEHQGKVKTIYVDETNRQKLAQGKIGIARIEGRYKLVPLAVAQKIRERNSKRIILIIPDNNEPDQNDPYAEFQVPDDIMW